MDHLRITVEGTAYDVVVEKISTTLTASSAPTQTVRSAAPAKAAPAKAAPAPAKAAAPAASAAGDSPSPLAGLVQAIEGKVGAAVQEGDLIITLEAMKMYTPINASMSGTITAIHVNVGDAVDEGQVLFTIG